MIRANGWLTTTSLLRGEGGLKCNYLYIWFYHHTICVGAGIQRQVRNYSYQDLLCIDFEGHLGSTAGRRFYRIQSLGHGKIQNLISTQEYHLVTVLHCAISAILLCYFTTYLNPSTLEFPSPPMTFQPKLVIEQGVCMYGRGTGEQ
jgi:hypothetical protein